MLLALALAGAQPPADPPAADPPAVAPAASGPTAPPGAFEIEGDVTLMSDYRFRGVSRSDEDPSLQASLTLRHDSGLYAGVRGTTLRGNDPWRLRNPAFGNQGDVEGDLYAGYRRELGGGFDLDAGVMYYVFAGGRGATDYLEPYASLGYTLGPAQVNVGAKYAPSAAATGHEDMVYLYGQLDISIPFRPWGFTASAGRQEWGIYGAYWNWSLGARYRLRLAHLPAAELALRYVDTDLPSRAGQDAGVQASVSFSF